MINYKIKLDTRENQKRKAGYPVVVFLFQNSKQKKINLGFYFEKAAWNFENNMPKKDARVKLAIIKKKALLEEIVYNAQLGKNIALNEVKNLLIGEKIKVFSTSFYDFADVFINELEIKGKIANAVAYKNAVDQLKKFRAKLDFLEIDYNLINDFKNYRIKLGNSKNTIHTYLRKYRAIYNEASRRSVCENKNPFTGVFAGITVKANRTKKRNITKIDVRVLESITDLPFAQQRSVDLWLLLFYFGGQDLKDLYYLENTQLVNGRVYFNRSKLDSSGTEFDLKVYPQAKKLLKKYKVKGKFVFPWRKDFAGYKTFRDNFRRSLILVQQKYSITVKPMGGNITIKVARHTFATIGKQLFVETDLLRELMGHERNDVDTIYKDKYPQEIRDAAQLKIIE